MDRPYSDDSDNARGHLPGSLGGYGGEASCQASRAGRDFPDPAQS
ncbi:hypothetical protein SSPS47_29005 [Streptomyces sp. S4.7]|nr:hypothetical protein SSPS47_29005 [Streptomyces sp. S4.7]